MAGAARNSALQTRRNSYSRAPLWYGIAVGLICLAAAVLWYQRTGARAEAAPHAVSVVTGARYIGSESCATCHRGEAAEWRASQHHDAMAEANEQAVLGDFKDGTFSYAGTTSTFFRHDGLFYVRTDGRDGKLANFQVKYTFGVYPLQQYLVEFPDGRVQALSIAWDARPKKEGGQRWFHLYPTERITHDDELHWTRPAQNWNFMCADCHSTGVRKNYDAAADRFRTRWSEINVGCEACHGPASRHVEWAAANKAYAVDNKGLTARLDERRGVSWSRHAMSGIASRSRPRETEREIEVCAQCHASRGQIADGYEAGKPLLDYYRPALLSSPLYHADGQQRGEVYDWGSFLQSKMYANGVTCSDCHEPHSGKLRAEGNALCGTCHLASKYDTPAHHNHPPASAGAACIACHMPATTYMVVDPRHDHSLRVPRPDLSVTLGTPTACAGCHKNRDGRWAASKVKAWYGEQPQGLQRSAEAISQPAIARATALANLDASTNRSAVDAVGRGLRDPSPLVRLGALRALARAPMDVRASLGAPLLSDPLLVLRIEAASLLAPVPFDQLGRSATFERAAAEFVESQRYNADRPEGRVNLGTFEGTRGDTAKAEDDIRAAIRLDPFFVPAYVNLADVYRVLDRDADGAQVLREGLRLTPDSAALHHALGLAFVRMKQADASVREFERATTLEPANARFAYVYDVALKSSKRKVQSSK
jgi:tetratricopeptide (TPR) repeat protein